MKAAAKKAAPKEDVEFYYDVEQRSEEWFELRRGLITASKLSAVMASGKDGAESLTRDKYMKLLAGELLSGQVAETFRSEAMERGNRMEPEAREYYERTRLVDLKPVGFVRRTMLTLDGSFVVGCSPDSQVSERKGLEIKSMAPHLLVDVKLRGAGGFPAGFRAQLQGTLRFCGWDEMDLLLFYTGWPNPPVFTVERDESFIREIDEKTEKFAYELKQLYNRILASQ
jgi:YqaJ-like viral recombinase domain